MADALPDEDETKTIRRSRLRHRYICTSKGHEYCFVDDSKQHVELKEGDLDSWVDTWVRAICTHYEYLAYHNCLVSLQSRSSASSC